MKKEIILKVSDTYVFELESHAGGGYSWTPVSNNEEITEVRLKSRKPDQDITLNPVGKGFLGAISAFVRGRHVRVDTFLNRFPPTLKRLVSIAGNVGMLVCCIMIAVGCWRLTLLNTANYLPVSGIPASVLYFSGIPFSVCVGIALLVSNADRKSVV